MLAPQSLSAAHLKGIGLVAAEWSYTEMALQSLIWEVGLLFDHRRAASITTHLQSETRLHILATLAADWVRDKDNKKELAVIIAEIRRLRTERNNIVHSIWLVPTPPKMHTLAEALGVKKKKGGRRPTPNLIKVTAKGSLVFTQTPYSSKKILGVAEEIGKLVLRMYAFLDKLREPARLARERREAERATRRLARGLGPTTTTPQGPEPAAPE
jgi:hypothetical protein